jgi:hypothetical protein
VEYAVPAGQSEPLRHWIERASGAKVAMEIRSFAEGLEREWPSVKAAIELPWIARPRVWTPYRNVRQSELLRRRATAIDVRPCP